MQRLIGFILSVGVGLLMTAAGLAYDVQALTYSGIFFVGLAAVLWGWYFGTGQYRKPIEVTAIPSSQEAQPPETDLNGRAVFALKRARDNGKIAYSRWSQDAALQAIHEIQAAMLSVRKQFGIGLPAIEGEGTYRMILKAYMYYLDLIYPLLREGHVEEAKKRASDFSFSWGE